MALNSNNLERESTELEKGGFVESKIQALPDEPISLQSTCSQLEHGINVDVSCTAKRHTPRGDVNLFEKMFEAWKNQETVGGAKDKCSDERLAYFQKNQFTLEQKVKDMKKTNDLLQKCVDSLHNELNWTDKVEQDNRNFKEKLKEAEEKLKEKETELKTACEHYESKIAKDQSDRKIELENMHKEMQAKIGKQEAERQAELEKHKQEIESFKQQLESAEKAKASELTALTMEYEDKLAKVQRLKTVSTHNQPQTSSHQEIFRKKLQHLKSEYDSETKNLKEQIKTLQAQISVAQACKGAPSGRQSVSPVPSFAKRARRF